MPMSKPEKYYIQYFTVRGKSRFPVDMLRYDRAFPRTGEDANKITRLLTARATGPADTEIEFERHSLTPDIGPTAARWASFGWEVTSVVYPNGAEYHSGT